MKSSRTINVGSYARLTPIFALAIALALIAVLASPAQAQTFNVIHKFTDEADGWSPAAGLIMDKEGNLYGTTSVGANGCGTVFQMAPSGSTWTFSTLYRFAAENDGCQPYAKLLLSGKLANL